MNCMNSVPLSHHLENIVQNKQNQEAEKNVKNVTWSRGDLFETCLLCKALQMID